MNEHGRRKIMLPDSKYSTEQREPLDLSCLLAILSLCSKWDYEEDTKKPFWSVQCSWTWMFASVHLFVSYSFHIFSILMHYFLVSAFKAGWNFFFIIVFMSVFAKAFSQHFKFQAVSPCFFPSVCFSKVFPKISSSETWVICFLLSFILQLFSVSIFVLSVHQVEKGHIVNETDLSSTGWVDPSWFSLICFSLHCLALRSPISDPRPEGWLFCQFSLSCAPWEGKVGTLAWDIL